MAFSQKPDGPYLSNKTCGKSFDDNNDYFVNKLKKSKISVLRHLINMTMKNTRSVTGWNIRGILLLSSKSRIDNLTVRDVKAIKYHPVCEEDRWIIKKMLQIKFGEMEIPTG